MGFRRDVTENPPQSDASMTILHTIAGLKVSAGGPSRVVAELTSHLAMIEEAQVVLLTQASIDDELLSIENSAAVRRVARSKRRLALMLGLPFQSELRQAQAELKFSLVHNHGLWEAPNHAAAALARSRDLPLVIQPHGTLASWSMQNKSLKKKLAMLAFQRRDLDSASLFVATSMPEHESLRTLGLRQPVAILPNGVGGNAYEASEDGVPDRGAEHKRTVLFLSRIHPVKGLSNLVEAWSRMDNTGWKLQVVGPVVDADHHRALVSRIQALGLQDSIEFMGEADQRRKHDFYRSADLFVLPTFTENFGAVVAEALTHGLPVITTRGAPWSDLETCRCGWWIDIGVEPLADALSQAMGLTDEARLAMGKRGREYVKRYDWSVIAGQMMSCYRWLLGMEDRPTCVTVE